MTADFDTEQIMAIRIIARDEISKQLKDIPTKSQFSHFARQMTLQNKVLNDSVQQLLGKQETWLMLLSAKDETVKETKVRLEHYATLSEDMSDRMTLLFASIHGNELLAGNSLVATVTRNSDLIERVSRWVENENDRMERQRKFRDKMLKIALPIFQNSLLRWLIIVGGGVIIGSESASIIEQLAK